MNIKISTDSISDLTNKQMQEQNISMIPLMINMGDDSIPDGEGMPQKIYDFVDKTGKLPKTGSRSVNEYKEFFKNNIDGVDGIIHFCISAHLSGSYNNALQASNEYDNVFVVDTMSLSCGAGLNVLYASDLAKDGTLSAKEIFEKCSQRAKFVQASFILDKLDYLHKGGRCSSVDSFFASVLKIKPMINLKDGKMLAGKKYKGKFEKAVKDYINDILTEYPNPDLSRLMIAKTTAPDELIETIKEQILQKYPFKEVITTLAGGTITSHCGKDTIGIFYFNDGDKQ